LFLVALALSAWYVAVEQPPFPFGPRSSLQPAPPLAPPPPLPLTYTVKRGDTFAGILGQFGVAEPLAAAGYREFGRLGLASLFPGDSLVVDLARDGRARAVALLSRLQCWYRLSLDSSAVNASRLPVEEAVHICAAKGELRTSLSEDMWRIGEGDALVAKLTEIFAWDINFFLDPRVGDRFEVLFEKRYAEGRFVGYGEVLAARYHTVSGHSFCAVGLRDSTGHMRYFEPSGKSVQKQFLKAPLRYTRVSSGFSLSRLHPVLGVYRPHLGVDYAAPSGTPVYAAADGTVAFAGTDGGFGHCVRLTHGAAYVTWYGHLQRVCEGVYPGARVRQGQLIGAVGATGLATGPHLDYRMQIDKRFVNPATVILPSAENVSEPQLAAFTLTRETVLRALDAHFAGVEGSWVMDVAVVKEPPRETRLSAQGGAGAGPAGS
jgi:murein DD-endopeptidase MepM/ murein hydrolase activator NlpD